MANVLTEEERTLLNYTMLANTLKTLTSTPEVDQILVVTRDTSVLALARDFNARTLQEDGSSHLNTALKRATVVAKMYSAQSVLVLPDDLPLLNVDSLQQFIRGAGKQPVVAIAPDRRREGTNALFISPVGILDYQFGHNSFQKHVAQAEKRHIRVEVCEIPELKLDLDLPEDLELLRNMELLQTDH